MQEISGITFRRRYTVAMMINRALMCLPLALSLAAGCGDASNGSVPVDDEPTPTPTAAPEAPGLVVSVVWEDAFGAASGDLDIHMVKDGGEPFVAPLDCYYENAAPEWGCELTDTDAPPEIATLAEPQASTYDVLIHFYPDGSEQSATVTLESDGSQIASASRVLLSNQAWSVWRVTYATSNGGPAVSFVDTLSTGPTY